MEFTIDLEIAAGVALNCRLQARRTTKDMIARGEYTLPGVVGVMFVDVELRSVVEQAIKNAGPLLLAWADS